MRYYAKYDENDKLLGIGIGNGGGIEITEEEYNALLDDIQRRVEERTALNTEREQILKEHRIIPETITAKLAFAKNECGVWKGALYMSLMDSNRWTPEAYPAGWEIVEQGGST